MGMSLPPDVLRRVLELEAEQRGSRAPERSIYPVAGDEFEFTDQVIEFARNWGWKVAHFRPAKTAKGWRTAVSGDGKGFVDLVLVRGRLLTAELKFAANKPTAEQRAWHEALRGAGVPVFVWYPADWPEIDRVLRGQV